MKFPSEKFFKEFKSTNGALSCCESIAISWLASQAPKGTYIDIGANAGKDAMSFAEGLSRLKENATLHMIDVVYDLKNTHAWEQSSFKSPDNTGWNWIYKSTFLNDVRERILSVSNGFVTANLIGEASLDCLPGLCENGVAMVFHDADHTVYDLIKGNCDIVKDKIIPGGIFAVHDYLNQYVAPDQILCELVASGDFEYIQIPWDEIIEFVREYVKEEGNISWHAPEEEFPCFVGAVKRKLKENI